ncbi:MAG TPA: DUF5305 family protein [Methanosarcinales archaeon]|nr:DUF5305 family protein [Methanosarcinales archaeon]
MKKSISRRLKIALVAILLIIMVSMSVLLYIAVKNPGVREEKLTLLNYGNKTDIKYIVFLKPNPLYSGDNLEEDKLYLTSFVDYIKTNFQYEFNIDKSADIKGDYEVVAIVEGYKTEEKVVKTIWQKEFILLPKTGFESKDIKYLINKEIIFSLAEYNIFATQIRESAELNVEAKVSVVMNVNLQAKTGENVIEKKFAPSITIPLSTSYFEIVKGGIEEKPEVVEEIKQIQLPVNQNIIITYGIIIGIAFLVLLYLLIFVKGNAPVDVFKKQLNKIFKSHGTRLVAINNEIGTTFGMYYKVKSIEDLVRIADELGRPIMYRYSAESKEITKFYIHDDKSMFSFNIKDMLAENDIEATTIESKALNDSKEVPLE